MKKTIEIIIGTLTMLFLYLVMLFFGGCQEYSVVEIPGSGILGRTDPNSPIDYSNGLSTFKGEAANIIAKQVSGNLKNAQERMEELFKRDADLYVGLVLLLVGGLIFWGFTKSRYGWVIPSASIGGIATILVTQTMCHQLVIYGKWIFTVVLAIAVLLLIWKAVEYHTERNEERAKNQKETINESKTTL